MELDEFSRKARLLREPRGPAGLGDVGGDRRRRARRRGGRAPPGTADRARHGSRRLVGTTAALGTRLEELAAAGATWSVLVPGGPPDRLDLIADEVLPYRSTA
jgi:alkanesulfonate monooxygenase SsuD/methylene tetrahydromethanopterin reductase-like flavin-dependent oxidoreductase (luciferase family)